MIEEYGIVTKIDSKTQQAWVRTQSKQGCGSCQSQGACGTGQATKFFEKRAKALAVHNRYSAKIGDTVRLGMADKALLYSALYIYLLPLMGLLIGSGFYTYLAESANDLGSLLSAILGLIIGMRLSRYIQSQSTQQNYQVVMLAIESRS